MIFGGFSRVSCLAAFEEFTFLLVGIGTEELLHCGGPKKLMGS